MNDRLSIFVNGQTVEKFVRYTVNHNIYTAAGEFDIEVPKSQMKNINELDRIEIKVNGTTALTGLVERIEETGKKGTATWKLSGRDLMGLVVDEYLQTFRTLANKTLLEVADYFLGEIDHVKTLPRSYINGADLIDIAQEWVQPRPGQTVFELLAGIAASRGIHFYMRADGEIVFGKPQGFGSHIYAIWRDLNGNSNITGWSRIRDASQRYSRVTVLGQQQSKYTTAVADINQKATVVDGTFPTGLTKTMVLETQTAAQTLALQARMIIEQQRFNGYSVRYVTPGHSQRGYVWQPDTICAVDDARLRIQEEMLIYGRSFVLDKNNKSTELLLGKMAS
jgi:prophage tail gpP-like protein